MVKPMNTASAGSNTTSRYPVRADKPTTPSRMSRVGVKQHSATNTVPATPTRIRVFGSSGLRVLHAHFFTEAG